MNSQFHAILGEIGLDYEGEVRPFLAAHYPGEKTWSAFGPGERRNLIKRINGDRDAFAAKVRAWHEEAAT